MLAGRSQLVKGLEGHLVVHTCLGRKGDFMRARGKVCDPSDGELRLPAACMQCPGRLPLHAPPSPLTLHCPPSATAPRSSLDSPSLTCSGSSGSTPVAKTRRTEMLRAAALSSREMAGFLPSTWAIGWGVESKRQLRFLKEGRSVEAHAAAPHHTLAGGAALPCSKLTALSKQSCSDQLTCTPVRPACASSMRHLAFNGESREGRSG